MLWKAIVGYEGYYEVSDTGEVRSLDRYVRDSTGKNAGRLLFIKGRILKQSENINKRKRSTSGYMIVNLRKNGMSKVIPVHILVAKAFVENINNNPTVNHKDGDKHNNKASNLEWVSYSYNNTHALENGLRSPRGCKVAQYDFDGNLIQKYESVSEAARQTGISRGGISHCVNNRTNSSGGYMWRKISESATTIPEGSTPEDELLVEAQRPFC